MISTPIGADLTEIMQELAQTGRQVKVLWQEEDSLAFVARGRDYRSEFHIDPSDELMYQLCGTTHLHYRTPEGKEEVAVLPEGSVLRIAAGTPHSPRFPSDAYALVIERKRRPGEVDCFRWFCAKCDNLPHEEPFIVRDYQDDPVSKAYRNFYGNAQARTCSKCGEVVPKPSGF